MILSIRSGHRLLPSCAETFPSTLRSFVFFEFLQIRCLLCLDAESDYQSDPTTFVPSEKSWALTENPDQNEDYGSKTLFVIILRRLISEICKGGGGNSSQTNLYIV